MCKSALEVKNGFIDTKWFVSGAGRSVLSKEDSGEDEGERVGNKRQQSWNDELLSNAGLVVDPRV